MNDFIGKGWAFPPQFNKYEGNVEMVSDQTEIEQSIIILFSTKCRERLFHSDFGCDLREFQFGSVSNHTILQIQDMIKASILQYESRIILNNLIVNTENILEGKLLIELTYTIKSTNSQYNMVFPYYFD